MRLLTCYHPDPGSWQWLLKDLWSCPFRSAVHSDTAARRILFKPRSSPSSTQSPPTAPTLTSEQSPAPAGCLLILSAPATLASLHPGPLHLLFSLSFLHGSLLHFLQDFTQRSPWLPDISESPTSTIHTPLSCLLFFLLSCTIM